MTNIFSIFFIDPKTRQIIQRKYKSSMVSVLLPIFSIRSSMNIFFPYLFRVILFCVFLFLNTLNDHFEKFVNQFPKQKAPEAALSLHRLFSVCLAMKLMENKRLTGSIPALSS